MAAPTRIENTMRTANSIAVEEVFDGGVHRGPAAEGPILAIPELFLSEPPIRDLLATHTSEIQDNTREEIMPFLSGDGQETSCNHHSVPHLDRKKHVKFLHRQFDKKPAPYIAADASRPWIFYWTLAALSLLGEDVSCYRDRLVETVRYIQNDTGGFGGGFGQTSHLCTTYGIVLALAMVGGQEAYDVIDRRSMWRWLCSLKQPGGGFQVTLGGEEDVRGAFCAAVIVSLLNLPLDLSPDSPAWTADGSNLYTGLPEYVRQCQTYEGGISAQPNAEAHGAYAFCGLGCLALLGPPHEMIPRYLDVPRLISWLSSRQYAPEGGFSGRTNKLVDSCYSEWVGGCWPLIEASLKGPGFPPARRGGPTGLPANKETLFHREGLIRYILCCCQDGKRGGLRDKPSKQPDAYHSCYSLCGLSSVQHRWELSSLVEDETTNMSEPKWTVSPFDGGEQVFDEEDRVCTMHPIYNIPEQKVDDMKRYFALKQGF